jgi:hypothetical protein
MSASPIARQACSHAQAIPSRKILITDASQMPEVYSSTPNGTIFSTTPGGKHFFTTHYKTFDRLLFFCCTADKIFSVLCNIMFVEIERNIWI